MKGLGVLDKGEGISMKGNGENCERIICVICNHTYSLFFQF